MAVRFEHTGDTFTIQQTSAGFRTSMYTLAAFAVMGGVIASLVARIETPTSLRCDHTSGTCTLALGRNVREISIASITSATVDRSLATGADPRRDVWITLRRTELPRYSTLCGTTGNIQRADVTSAFGGELSAFLADPAHPPIELHCTGREVNGANLGAALPFALLGVFVIAFLFAPFSVEVRAVLDRRSGTIEVHGRGWLRRRWDVKRPLSDVRTIAVRSRNAGRGARAYSVHAVFADDTSVLLWAPAAATLTTINARAAAMQAFVRGA